MISFIKWWWSKQDSFDRLFWSEILVAGISMCLSPLIGFAWVGIIITILILFVFCVSVFKVIQNEYFKYKKEKENEAKKIMDKLKNENLDNVALSEAKRKVRILAGLGTH